MKYLIIVTLLLSIVVCCNKPISKSKSEDKNKIELDSILNATKKEDSIYTEKKRRLQIEADSICSYRGHIFEKCDSKLREFYRENTSNVYLKIGTHYNANTWYEELPDAIVDYEDRTEIVTTKKERKYCYRCMRHIKIKKQISKKVIWTKD